MSLKVVTVLYITFHLSTTPVWHKMAASMPLGILHSMKRDGHQCSRTQIARHYSLIWRIQVTLPSQSLLDLGHVPLLMSRVGESYIA